jgi:LuxR family quorum sensing-dependent transcriptional regulator
VASLDVQIQQSAFDCIEQLGRLTCIEDIAARLRQAGTSFGFENFCISGLPLPGEQLDPYVLLSGWPDAWMERYIRGGYVHVDPVISRVRQSTMPFAWSETPADRRDALAIRVMNEATEFGLVDGLAVPIHARHGFQAIVTFGAPYMAPSHDERAALHLIAIYAHGQVRQLLRGDSPSRPTHPPLSTREKDCLCWASAGKSAWDISVILGLSQRTVEGYLVNAAIKLGAVNRVQCVAEAIRRGIIS